MRLARLKYRLRYQTFIAVLFSSAVLSSCETYNEPLLDNSAASPAPVSPPSGPTVYATGNMNTGGGNATPVYWKNGTVQTLSYPSGFNAGGSAIAVRGADVHIAGNGPYAAPQVHYWKNGTLNFSSPSAAPAHVFEIATLGSDVYMAGDENNRAVYWKNNVKTDLSTIQSQASQMTISGSDVYICGVITPAFPTPFHPVYWKNGVLNNIPGFDFYIANFIAVRGTDIYISGETDLGLPGYWKNNVWTTLSTSTGSVNTILFAANGEMYCGGYEWSGAQTKAVYWKNNVRVDLNGSNYSSSINGGFVLGNDIYFGGGIATASGAGNSRATVWKNGMPQTYPGGSSVFSLYIVP